MRAQPFTQRSIFGVYKIFSPKVIAVAIKETGIGETAIHIDNARIKFARELITDDGVNTLENMRRDRGFCIIVNSPIIRHFNVKALVACNACKRR